MSNWVQYPLRVAIIALVYVVTGTVGLSLHAIGGLAPLLWAPSAIGLAVVLLYGPRWWPGIVLGTAMVAVLHGLTVRASLIIMAADVAEALVGYCLLRGLFGFRNELDRVRDVLVFVEVCVVISLLSATFSVTMLFSAGLIEQHRTATLWATWWWSHLSSDLIIAPAILTCARRRPRHAKRGAKRAEAVALTLTVLIVVLLVLGRSLPPWLPASDAPYYLLPMLLWAGVRFGPRGAALASLGACVTAIVAQSFGLGPFHRVFDLQSFVAISTISTLMLSAVAIERVRAVERKGAIQLAALDGIITIDRRGHLVELNPAAERMFSLRAADVIGKDLGSLVVPPRLREEYQRGLYEFLSTSVGASPGCRYRSMAWRAATNDEFPVEIAITPVPLEDDVLITAFIRDRSAEDAAEATIRDAHHELERKVEERTAELKRRQLLMRQAEELAHLGSFDFNLADRSLEWSDELFRIYGRDMSTFVPNLQRFLDAVHPDDRAIVQSRIDQATQDHEPFALEDRIVRPDGSVRVLQTLVRVIVDDAGRATRLVGCCQDITERKHDEAVRSRLVQLVESSDDAIIGLSAAGSIQTWNAAAARLFGYADNEVLGRPSAMLLPDSFHACLDEKLEAVRAGDHVARYELKNRRKDGSVFDASVTLSAALDQEGHVVAMSKVVRDVTEQKHVESQLRWSLREKEVLLREIHHRVKNNLQVIASLLNLQVSAEKSHAVRKGLIESQNRIQSMALVHQLLYRSKDLAQIDTGRYLRELTKRLVDTYNVAPERIAVDVASSPLRLDIDRAIPCGLIVNELVTNALTHAFPKGQHGRISVTLAQAGDEVVLTVDDDGVGIPPQLKLEQLNTFGLRIAHTLTQQLDGTITLTREAGTHFRIVFPLAGRRTNQ